MLTRRFSFSKKILCIILAGNIFLSGCATTGSTMLDESSPVNDPRLTQGEDAKFFSSSGWDACITGAGIGVVACVLSNSSNKLACSVIAGLVACGVGLGANYYYDQRRTQFANTSERLQAMANDIKQDTANIVTRTATIQQVIDDDKQRISDIQRDINNKQLNQEKAKKEISSIDKNIALMRKDIGNMNEKVKEYNKVVEFENKDNKDKKDSKYKKEISKVNEEISIMESKVLALQQEVDGLYNQRSAITLG